MTDPLEEAPDPLGDAMRAFVDASQRVTAVLIRMAKGETVDASEIEDARKDEVVALARYMGQMAGTIFTKVELSRGQSGSAEEEPAERD